ncbi:MAG: methylamine dehydrogenase, partial [Deltaproteobacteria bacterium]|nr:methylamine dehydrogenase [Deltaproteobacteria bacterium]
MIDALIVSNVILWLAVIGLALTTFALTRQIGLLHERISPVGALSPQTKLEVGSPAPELAVL